MTCERSLIMNIKKGQKAKCFDKKGNGLFVRDE